MLEFEEQMRAILGDETDAFLKALEERPSLALRVNPLRPGSEALAAEFVEGDVPWCRWGRYLAEGVRPGLSVAHELGAFYLQEASAMASAAVLDAQPGEVVLDLCAAPGGKSTQIASGMMGRGVLVCNEPVPSRAKILAENLERFGAVNAVAVCAYPEKLAEKWQNFFDAILVDAPCSGEGMFRRDPDARNEWNPKAPEGCARRQADILDAAAAMLKPGGRLVYSTCTFNLLENEGSIENFLTRHPEFCTEDFELTGVGRSVNGTIRLFPHRVRGDGHFVARLRKVGRLEAVVPKSEKISKKSATKKIARTVSEESNEQLLTRLEEFCSIPEVLRSGTLIRQADYVHMLPFGAPNLDGIRVVKPGLCLMRVGRSHVQPMPALARASAVDNFVENLGKAVNNWEVDGENVRKILAGERPEVPFKGWGLVGWHGIGFAFVKGRGSGE